MTTKKIDRYLQEDLGGPFDTFMDDINDLREVYQIQYEVHTNLEDLVYSMNDFIKLENQYVPKVKKLYDELNKKWEEWENGGHTKLIEKLGKDAITRFMSQQGYTLTKKDLDYLSSSWFDIYERGLTRD